MSELARHVEEGVVSTVDAVAAALRNLIFDGEIRPGERLREVDYAERFAVARHSFRAATQVLVYEGLLKRTPNRGVHVPVLHARDVIDIYRLRSAIELEAVRIDLLERHPVAEAERVVEAFLAMPDRAPWREVVNLDLRFHRSLITATRSPRLIRAYQMVESEITLALVQLRAHYREPVKEVAGEHLELLAPIVAGDEAEAERRFRAHFDDAVANLVGSVEPGAVEDR